MMIAVLIINYRTADATIACIQSLLPELSGEQGHIYLLDNGSNGDDAARLKNFACAHPEIINFAAVEENLGFARGMNFLLERAFVDPKIDKVLLLNSDTLPMPGFLRAMQTRLDKATRTEMVAARLVHPEDASVDSLGIALYRCTLASNRKFSNEILLGPTGGCALFTRSLLEDLCATHGECFDSAFFCYAEDTDLALRALSLGYKAAYAQEAVVFHVGALSSGGPDSDFVLYYGIRNSLWWLVKNAPLGWFVRSLPWFMLLHLGILLRHIRWGRGRVLWRLYRDAIKGIPEMLRKRTIIQSTRRVPSRLFRHWVDRRFYERGYMRRAWRELW